MRYRRLDANGDYSFGQGGANFLVDDVACVAQSVRTRLLLWQGEWFLNTAEGTPWLQQILGNNAKVIYDLAIQQRVLQTRGVTKIARYTSTFDGTIRKLTIELTIDTQFGQAQINAAL